MRPTASRAPRATGAGDEGNPSMTSTITRAPRVRGRTDGDPPRHDDAPDAPDAADVAQPAEGGPARTWRPTPRLLWGVALVLLLAAVAVAATLGRAAWQSGELATSRAEALAAGKQHAVNFVTMNHATFDADTKRVLDGATGDFRKEYSETLAKLKPVVVQNKTVSTVQRAEAALVSGDADSAQVIVGLVAPTSNTGTTTPEKKTYRLRLDLVKDGAAWKVSSLDFVS